MDQIPNRAVQAAQQDVTYILHVLRTRNYVARCISLDYEIADGEGTSTLDIAVHAKFFIERLKDSIDITWEYFLDKDSIKYWTLKGTENLIGRVMLAIYDKEGH